MTFTYEIKKKTKGSRTFFYPEKNGKRFSKTLFARKYDAVGTVENWVKRFGVEKLNEMFEG